jgi:single-stranded-DNA-specific exonuclease
MLHPKSRWEHVSVTSEEITGLITELPIHPLIARILIGRGIREKAEIERFLHPSINDLHDPYLLDGVTVAVERVRLAIQNQESILVYGDYDVDGVSSTSLMLFVLQHLGAKVDYYIPNRFREGYGLHQDAIELAKQNGVTLILTVDTGISAVDQAAYAKSIGLDLIITDHHEPPAVLPDAYAVINPKKPTCSYPFKQLAGVGVAAKLATALLGRVPEEWLDLVALGTIADLVPLTGENRVFATYGLIRMNERKNIGLSQLIEVSGIEKDVTTGHVGFSLGPRINASGRLESAGVAVELLTTTDKQKAKELASYLNEKNVERQNIVDTITQAAIAQVESEIHRHRKVIVVHQAEWNLGVVGIVASRLVDTFYRPAIVLGTDEKTGLIKGSARSIQGFHLYQALTASSVHLSQFGGHEMAAGMTLPLAQMAPFHEQLTKLADEWLMEKDYIKGVSIEETIPLSEVNTDLIDSLEQLAPYGMKNPIPLFQIAEAETEKLDWMGGQANHLKLHLKDKSGNKLEAIRFRCGELADQLTVGAQTQVVGELQMNEWNGRRKPQMIIRDLAIPHLQIFDWRTNQKSERVSQLAGTSVGCICADKKKYSQLTEGQLFSWDDDIPQDFPFVHLALLDVPPSVSRFEQVLKSLHPIERIYVCFGDKDITYHLPVVPDRQKCKLLYQTLWSKRKTPFPLKASIQPLSKRLGMSERAILFLLDAFQELQFIKIENDIVEVLTNPSKKELTDSTIYQHGKDQSEVLQVLIYSSYRELCKTIKGV